MWSTFLTPVAIAIVFALLARMIPARPRAAHVQRYDERLLQSASSGVTLATIACSVAAGFVIFEVLSWIGRLVLAPKEPGELLLAPSAVFWFLPSIFLGLLAGAGLVGAHMSARDEQFADAIADYESRRTGVELQRIERPLATLLLLACGLTVALLLGWSVRFGSDAIVEDPFLPRPVITHRYEDVRGVQVTRMKGRSRDATERFDLNIRFADAHVLSSRNWPKDLSADELRALAQRIAARAGVAVQGPSAAE